MFVDNVGLRMFVLFSSQGAQSAVTHPSSSPSGARRCRLWCSARRGHDHRRIIYCFLNVVGKVFRYHPFVHFVTVVSFDINPPPCDNA